MSQPSQEKLNILKRSFNFLNQVTHNSRRHDRIQLAYELELLKRENPPILDNFREDPMDQSSIVMDEVQEAPYDLYEL